MPPRASLQLGESTAQRKRAAVALALREWARIDINGDWLAQWRLILPRVVAITGMAQAEVARLGAESVRLALASQGYVGEAAEVLAAGFAGWIEPPGAVGVIPLSQALYEAPVVTARRAGDLATGARWLQGLIETAIGDAGRNGTQAGIVGRSKVYGTFYEPGDMCQRCAVLVGKRLHWGVDFKRHPRCDGTIVPIEAKEQPDFTLDPARVKDLTAAQRQAIDDGADFNRVVNANAPRYDRAADLWRPSTYDSGSRTIAGSGRRSDGERLTPKGIYQTAGDDRQKAQQLLRDNGYLV